ncbi:MFS transporter [Sphingomonas prati]|uniref:Putative MFS family arabinose efflux permease n=1 Tax=Sphingomonas prati TaxID=1843237 RepID=A0A7W9F193_9SPHN|nr:MFS transporter [Sphingomonas prati]MBB5729063.1 putative MFS family arabinose efflux permease [Sphingomonas prati]GGE85382.1 MFS-type efflux pump [Sphingomonas prati]
MLFVLFLVGLFSQIDRMLPFIMAESIKEDLSLSDTQVGLLTGLAFALCYALFSLPLARASDRGSPRFVLVACALVWSAMTALGAFAESFLFLAFTRFGVALGEAGGSPATHAIISRKIRPQRRGLAIGIFSLSLPLGTMVAFALGGAITDTHGWRAAVVGAGAFGAAVTLLMLFVTGPTPPLKIPASTRAPYLRSSLRLLSSAGFRWLFIGAIVGGFAAAPFYAFAAPFLIRTHGYSASEAGLAFGLLQGLMGIMGTLVGGRMFDRAIRAGAKNLLGPPGVLFVGSSVTMTAALFVPTGWVSIALLVPTMLSFAFLLPWGFGSAHFLAGTGNEAMATSLIMIGSGLLGPAFGPLIVGMVSDAASSAQMSNGLGLGLLTVPIASFLCGLAILTANREIAGEAEARRELAPRPT